MGVLEMNLEEVLAAKLLLANLTDDSTSWSIAVAASNSTDQSWRGWASFNVDSVHLQHVSLHEVLVAQLLFANLTVASAQ